MDSFELKPVPRYHMFIDGGGAKGSHSVGWLLEFFQDSRLQPVHIASISGTSVGAYIAAAVATNQFSKLYEMFSTLENSDVYRKGLWPLRMLAQGYLYNFEPLYRLLRETLYRAQVVIPFTVTVWNATTNEVEYHTFKQHSYLGEMDIKIIFASGVMPGFAAYVPIYGCLYADGGIKDASPLRKFFKEPAHDMKDGDSLIILHHTKVAEHSPKGVVSQPLFGKNLDLIINDGLIHEILLNDLKLAKLYNNNLSKLEVNIIEVEPDAPLGNALDFSKKYLEAGRQCYKAKPIHS